jgi:hypothetical protein
VILAVLNHRAAVAETGRDAHRAFLLRLALPRPVGGAHQGALREGEHRAADVRTVWPALRATAARRARVLLFSVATSSVATELPEAAAAPSSGGSRRRSLPSP